MLIEICRFQWYNQKMIQIEVDSNPNCEGIDQFVRNELGPPKTIAAISAEVNGQETICDVVGVEVDGKWTQAHALKVADSSDGFAFLIQGGAWGIRMRPEMFRDEAWDLDNKHQWGEPFKLYGSEEDIIYA